MSYAMAAIWLCSCALDMGHTVRLGARSVCAYEQNPVMRPVLRLTGSLPAAAAVALAVEAGFVLGGSFVVVYAWDPRVFGMLCGAAAGVHLSGYAESRRFLRNVSRNSA